MISFNPTEYWFKLALIMRCYYLNFNFVGPENYCIFAVEGVPRDERLNNVDLRKTKLKRGICRSHCILFMTNTHCLISWLSVVIYMSHSRLQDHQLPICFAIKYWNVTLNDIVRWVGKWFGRDCCTARLMPTGRYVAHNESMATHYKINI